MREIYIKIKQKFELPIASLSYSFRDSKLDGVIHPFSVVYINFNDDNESIRKMESVKDRYGDLFMFFNNSDEGVEFWEKNPIISIEPNK